MTLQQASKCATVIPKPLAPCLFAKLSISCFVVGLQIRPPSRLRKLTNTDKLLTLSNNTALPTCTVLRLPV